MSLAPPEESAVCDFAIALLACGYARIRRVLQTRGGIPFLICGKNKQTKADVCILATMKLFINNTSKKTNPMVSPGWLRPRTSTYRRSTCRVHYKQRTAREDTGLATMPIQNYYAHTTSNHVESDLRRLPSTKFQFPRLSLLLHRGRDHPEQETTIRAHRPAAAAVLRPSRRLNEGMKLDNRRIILSCYGAFSSL